MKITILNKQKVLKINSDKIKKQINIILQEEKIDTQEVILNFVNEKAVKDLHIKYFNDPTVTDCISFPIDSASKKTNGYHILGEAFICPKQAVICSKRYKTTVYEELALYVIHCILHLIGYDDIKQIDRSLMRKKEKYYLSLFKRKKTI
ncbi:MAG: hypothetical protein ACD_7C00186G0001 [uncultured bacterium]|nr:MAG: hypothetical protein ACD_7C00186G0001 [uncultured bacterium]